MPIKIDSFWDIGKPVIQALIVIAAGIVAVRLGEALIQRIFKRTAEFTGARLQDNRAKTLAGILTSTLRYTIVAMVSFTMLELVGIDTKALLGGVAILGLAVGFGAQSLVKDIITGFFIIYERQYDIGDYISAAGLSGVVEDIGLRTTRLRDWSGDVHIIPNGLIDKTTNKSKADSRALVEITLSHEDEVNIAMEELGKVCQEVSKLPAITSGPRVLGITKLGTAGVTLTIWAKTKPLEQWGVERELRLRSKQALQQVGIEIPYTKVSIVADDDHVQ